MKKLTQHIQEKLRIDKDWKPEDIIYFDDITEVFAIGYAYYHETFFILKYEISRIDKHNNNGQIVYIMNGKSKTSYGFMDLSALWNKDNNLLYAVTGNTNYILIHPNDTEKLNKLYDYVINLKPNDKYTLNDILSDKLNIDINCIEDDPYVYLECNMSEKTISDLKNDIKQYI